MTYEQLNDPVCSTNLNDLKIFSTLFNFVFLDCFIFDLWFPQKCVAMVLFSNFIKLVTVEKIAYGSCERIK